MKKRISTVSGLALALALTFTGAAHGATLGTATQPENAEPSACGENAIINQLRSDPSTPYHVPGTGTITQWQINTTDDTPGSPVTLVVLRPAGFGGFSVVGVDARTIPTPLPAGNIATFSLSTPIAVQAGDTFGLFTDSNGAVVCFWDQGSTPLGDSVVALTAASAPVVGQVFAIVDSSNGGFTMNLAATFEPPAPPATPKKKCKKKRKKHKRSAESAKKKCKKKKKR
jgi:hypothetical protein